MTKKSRLVYEKSHEVNSKNRRQYFEETKTLWLPISVGQNYHETPKLDESINLIINNFKHITLIRIVIVDLAQKYHLAINNNSSPENMIEDARKNGIDWKTSNSELIESGFKGIAIEFITWEHWLEHGAYKQARDQINDLYNDTKTKFKEILEKDVLEFERRFFNRKNRYFTELEKEYCRECIKEECAILIVWNKDQVSVDYSCIIYPKNIPLAMSFVKNNLTHFMSMHIEFSSKSNNKPLLFQPRKDSLNEESQLILTTESRKHSI